MYNPQEHSPPLITTNTTFIVEPFPSSCSFYPQPQSNKDSQRRPVDQFTPPLMVVRPQFKRQRSNSCSSMEAKIKEMQKQQQQQQEKQDGSLPNSPRSPREDEKSSSIFSSKTNGGGGGNLRFPQKVRKDVQQRLESLSSGGHSRSNSVQNRKEGRHPSPFTKKTPPVVENDNKEPTMSISQFINLNMKEEEELKSPLSCPTSPRGGERTHELNNVDLTTSKLIPLKTDSITSPRLSVSSNDDEDNSGGGGGGGSTSKVGKGRIITKNNEGEWTVRRTSNPGRKPPSQNTVFPTLPSTPPPFNVDNVNNTPVRPQVGSSRLRVFSNSNNNGGGGTDSSSPPPQLEQPPSQSQIPVINDLKEKENDHIVMRSQSAPRRLNNLGNIVANGKVKEEQRDLISPRSLRSISKNLLQSKGKKKESASSSSSSSFPFQSPESIERTESLLLQNQQQEEAEEAYKQQQRQYELMKQQQHQQQLSTTSLHFSRTIPSTINNEETTLERDNKAIAARLMEVNPDFSLEELSHPLLERKKSYCTMLSDDIEEAYNLIYSPKQTTKLINEEDKSNSSHETCSTSHSSMSISPKVSFQNLKVSPVLERPPSIPKKKKPLPGTFDFYADGILNLTGCVALFNGCYICGKEKEGCLKHVILSEINDDFIMQSRKIYRTSFTCASCLNGLLRNKQYEIPKDEDDCMNPDEEMAEENENMKEQILFNVIKMHPSALENFQDLC